MVGCWVPGDVWGVGSERAFWLDLVGDVSAKYARYSKADNTTLVSTWVIRGTKRVTIFTSSSNIVEEDSREACKFPYSRKKKKVDFFFFNLNILASSLRVFLFGNLFPVICNVLITQWQNLSGCKLSYLC